MHTWELGHLAIHEAEDSEQNWEKVEMLATACKSGNGNMLHTGMSLQTAPGGPTFLFC